MIFHFHGFWVWRWKESCGGVGLNKGQPPYDRTWSLYSHLNWWAILILFYFISIFTNSIYMHIILINFVCIYILSSPCSNTHTLQLQHTHTHTHLYSFSIVCPICGRYKQLNCKRRWWRRRRWSVVGGWCGR